MFRTYGHCGWQVVPRVQCSSFINLQFLGFSSPSKGRWSMRSNGCTCRVYGSLPWVLVVYSFHFVTAALQPEPMSSYFCQNDTDCLYSFRIKLSTSSRSRCCFSSSGVWGRSNVSQKKTSARSSSPVTSTSSTQRSKSFDPAQAWSASSLRRLSRARSWREVAFSTDGMRHFSFGN